VHGESPGWAPVEANQTLTHPNDPTLDTTDETVYSFGPWAQMGAFEGET